MVYSLLDCTLRDGGSTIGFNFPSETICQVVEHLDSAGVDYVELGYRSGSGSVSCTSPGPTFHVDHELLSHLPPRRRIKYALMVVAAVGKAEDVDFAKEAGIDLVRIAVYPHNFEQALTFLNKAARLSLRCSLNIMASSYLAPVDLLRLAQRGQNEGADLVYFADSFGHFLPSDVSERVERLKASLEIPVGFHAHNNLGCAAANAISAVRSGADFIDASLCGMGRGAGNTQTELWSIISNRLALRTRNFREDILCEIAEAIHPLVKNPHADNSLLLSGAANLHAFFWQHIAAAVPEDTFTRYKVAFELGKNQPRKVSAEAVNEIVNRINQRQEKSA